MAFFWKRDTAEANEAERPSTPALSPGAIEEALRLLLEDERFRASPRNRQFLAYVVHEDLEGRGDRIKAYGVAVEVFGRPALFDADADPIVRIEAARLRRCLDDYFDARDCPLSVRISIPKGRYRPRFDPMTAAVPEEHDGSAGHRGHAAPSREPDAALGRSVARRRRLAPFVGVAVAAFAALAALWATRVPPPAMHDPPRILVAPLEPFDKSPDAARVAWGLTRDLVDRLTRFHTFAVYGPLAQPPEAHGNGEATASLAGRVRPDFILQGMVTLEDTHVVLNAQLQEAATGRFIWTFRAERDLRADALMAALFDLASGVASRLGQPDGVLNKVAWLQYQAHSMDAYGCVLMAQDYYRRIDRGGHARARDCLERAVDEDPTYATAFAMLAWVYLDEARYGFNPRPELYDAQAKARATVDHALALDPDNDMALHALAVIEFRSGDMAGFRATGDRMVALNPNDPDILAGYGSRLAFSGDWTAGMPLMRRAIELNIDPPGTYAMVFAWDAYRRGDLDEARVEAERIDMPDFPLAALTRAAVYGELGLAQQARSAAGDLRRLGPGIANDPHRWLIQTHFDPAFSAALVAGLRKAGLDAP